MWIRDMNERIINTDALKMIFIDRTDSQYAGTYFTIKAEALNGDIITMYRTSTEALAADMFERINRRMVELDMTRQQLHG